MSTQFALDLRQARRKAGYTQGDVAHLLGMKQAVMCRLEQGSRGPTLPQVIALSLLYGRSFESLFAEIMAEARQTIQIQQETLPPLALEMAHTFNREKSLARLRRRLMHFPNHG